MVMQPSHIRRITFHLWVCRLTRHVVTKAGISLCLLVNKPPTHLMIEACNPVGQHQTLFYNDMQRTGPFWHVEPG